MRARARAVPSARSHYCWWNRMILKPIQKYGNAGLGESAFYSLVIRRRTASCAAACSC